MNHKEAHFLHRLLATFIDAAIGFAVNLYVIDIVVKSTNIPELASNIFLFLLVLLSPFGLLYQVLLTQWFGGTLGKLLTGIKISSLDGTPLTFKRIMFRQTIGYMFSSLLFGFGYLAILKNDRRQAWHDQAVGSLVIKTGNFWVIGFLVWVALLGVLGYFGTQTVQSAIANEPLKQSFITLYNQFQAERQPAGIDVRSEPKAKVFINDEEKGETPYFDDKIAPGEYKISLRTDDSKATNWEGNITLTKGITTVLSRDLNTDVNAGEIITLKEGTGLSVTSNPSEAIITVDGKAAGKTPYQDQNLSLGEHEIILEKSGSLGRMITITVRENNQTTLHMDLGKESTISTPSKTAATPSAPTVTPQQKQEAIKYWQDELSYINQEITNLKLWINSDKDQTKINRMVAITNEQKAFATKSLAKSQNDETFTLEEGEQAKKYAQMTEEYNKLLDEVFPR